ncbi:hypothetical protein G6F66_014672 [Rhizopus arrhizus]|nr:hypothetical protein G6F66_014672 [Rhizopus arrhizus]
MAEVVRAQAGPADTFVALHTYPFALALYARAPHPMWVGDDWREQEVPVRDNWRKELYDAAQFDPVVGKRVLVDNGDLTPRLCAAADGARFWIWGRDDDASRYPAIAGVPARIAGDQRAVWRIDIDAAFRQRMCAGLPAAR